MSSEHIQLSRLVLDIYDTAMDPALWPTVLDKISRFVGARGSFIFAIEGEGEERRVTAPYYSAAYQPRLVEDYLKLHNRQELADQDRFALHSKQTDGIELIGDEVLADSEAELLARPNAQLMMQYGLRYRAGALLNKDYISEDRFAMQFSSRHGPFSGPDREKTGLILPHVAKALNITRPTRQLHRNFRNVLGSLDLLKVGVCLIDDEATIVYRNSEFSRQVAEHRVFALNRENKLIVSNRYAAALAELMGDVFNHGRFGARPRKEAIVTVRDDHPCALCIELCPISSADELGDAHFSGYIVYSLDTSQPFDFDATFVAKAFRLTKAEHGVLALMGQGMTNSEIGEYRDTSVETVNTQVKSILAKTQSSNRTQLIRLATNMSLNFVNSGVTNTGDARAMHAH